MRILITGASGFAGRHLGALLKLSKRLRVFGLVRAKPAGDVEKPVDEWITGDIANKEDAVRAVETSRPDRVYHLAGQSYIPAIMFNPEEVLRVNVIGTCNLLAALRQFELKSKVLIASSSEVYGPVPRTALPISENRPARPVNFYGVSKVSQEMVARQFAEAGPMRVICTRAFNHIGPGQNARFSISGFARQIALIERGRLPNEIVVGNLEAVRDFTDVRDTVRAYRLAIEKAGAAELYNIGSGKGYAIREILDRLLRLSKVNARVRVDRARLRPSDVPAHVADCRKFRRDTAWQPQIRLQQTLEDTLNYWRANVDAE